MRTSQRTRTFLISILNRIGLKEEEILEKSKTEDVKFLLRKQTERASALGIFGAPSFYVGEELFWGDDRLEDALEELKRFSKS
ncbi:DsbA family protein [Leptospira interrogans serovar Canicola]|nr:MULTISPECIES: DsbA family protein [Leptospira]MCH5431703.1 DsbA family protein [Leptospira interrogans serovar Canicola]